MKIIILLILAGLLIVAGPKYYETDLIPRNDSNDHDNIPGLWNYTDNNNQTEFNDIPANYQNYIMLDNLAIRQYAKKLRINSLFDGLIYELAYENGQPLEIKPQEQNKKNDWQNPDYTLLVAKKGDCEDVALVIASIMEAKGIKSVIVLGYVYRGGKEYGHAWVEYYANKTYFMNSGLYFFTRPKPEDSFDYYYYSPEINLINRFNQSDQITISSEKYRPFKMFGKNLNLTSYDGDWILNV